MWNSNVTFIDLIQNSIQLSLLCPLGWDFVDPWFDKYILIRFCVFRTKGCRQAYPGDEVESASQYSADYSESNDSVDYGFTNPRSSSVSTAVSYREPSKKRKRRRKCARSSQDRSRSNSRSQSRYSSRSKDEFGVLPIKYWERTEECQEAKFNHMERLDSLCDSREMLVLNTTLYECHTALERNMFPCESLTWASYICANCVSPHTPRMTRLTVWSTLLCGVERIWTIRKYATLWMDG